MRDIARAPHPPVFWRETPLTHPPLARLALLACLPAAAWAGAASAGTVTLLSQERSVSAFIPGSDLFGSTMSSPVGGTLASGEEIATDFGAFDASASFRVDGEEIIEDGRFIGIARRTRFASAGARQSSSFEQIGDDVFFVSDAGVGAFGSGGSASVQFEVTFLLSEATDFRLTGTGNAMNDEPRFIFEDAAGGRVLDLGSFNESPTFPGGPSPSFVFDGTGVDPSFGELFPTAGTLEAGTYRFGFSGTAFDPGFDPGSFNLNNFGIVFANSILATPDDTDDTDDGPVASDPVAIPSPAALPAGLALLAGGLLRRRRVG